MNKIIQLAKVTLLSIVLVDEVRKLKKCNYLYFKGVNSGVNGGLRVTNNSKYNEGVF